MEMSLHHREVLEAVRVYVAQRFDIECSVNNMYVHKEDDTFDNDLLVRISIIPAVPIPQQADTIEQQQEPDHGE